MNAPGQPQDPHSGYVLHLRPVPAAAGEADLMLRMALKVLLRRFGLRCVKVERAKNAGGACGGPPAAGEREEGR